MPKKELMPMIVQFRICVIDGKHPPHSDVYKTLKDEHGVKFANRWTKVVSVDLAKL